MESVLATQFKQAHKSYTSTDGNIIREKFFRIDDVGLIRLYST
jgi:hypothetical protein